MADSRAAPVPAPDFQPDPLSNGCAQVAALDRQTAAIEALTAKIDEVSDKFASAADAIADLGGAQKKFCDFLVGNRLKLVASVPILLTLVGAISPNAAHLISGLLQAWGVQ